MGYTHYYYLKNPVVEMTQLRLKKEQIRNENRGNWEKMQQEFDKLPSHASLVKRIDKQVKCFEKAAGEINKALANLPSGVVIKGGHGEGEPVVETTYIWFNGDDSKGLSHETFGLGPFDMGGFQSFEEIEKDGVFGFCKTARKPYDLMVCVSLMILKHNLGADFKISSDGGLNDWREAIDFYENLFDRKAPKQLMNYFKKEGQEA